MEDRQPRPTGTLRVLVKLPLVALVLCACDPHVTTFEETEHYYSIFGYLDASADTQFVRIEPIRDGLLGSAPPVLDARVRLTNLATGRTSVLRDSLVRMDTSVVHNYYTTVDIRPGTSYRLRLRGDEGEQTTAETTVPEAFPPVKRLFPAKEIWFPDCDGYQDGAVVRVLIPEMNRLVALQARLQNEQSRFWTFDHLPDTMATDRLGLTATINYGHDYCRIPENRRSVRAIDVVVAAGSPGWPRTVGLSRETLALPVTATNVKGGVGFLGGIVSDTVEVYSANE